jgi:hypothetical protein
MRTKPRSQHRPTGRTMAGAPSMAGTTPVFLVRCCGHGVTAGPHARGLSILRAESPSAGAQRLVTLQPRLPGCQAAWPILAFHTATHASARCLRAHTHSHARALSRALNLTQAGTRRSRRIRPWLQVSHMCHIHMCHITHMCHIICVTYVSHHMCHMCHIICVTYVSHPYVSHMCHIICVTYVSHHMRHICVTSYAICVTSYVSHHMPYVSHHMCHIICVTSYVSHMCHIICVTYVSHHM